MRQSCARSQRLDHARVDRPVTMNSADFSLAQERIEARRRLRRTATSDYTRADTASALHRLPPTTRLRNVGLRTWESIRGREGTRPAFRVGQVDAELLDEELLDLFKGQVGEGLKYFGVPAEFSKQ